MHLRRLLAEHFGPFDHKVLELGRGLTVVWGPNEAGKSSWHSALAVTLGGMRRKRGPGTKEERLFEQKHRPWQGDGWAVRGELVLDDGRLLEIFQDLDAKTGLVRDLDVGKDLTNDYMSDGGIDLCSLTGLDRSSFAATACVRQSDLIAIRDDAEILQEHMQRAAATAGTDATAAAALDGIAEFRKEAVGLDRVTSSKPLRRAVAARQDAQAAVEEAERLHAEWLELVKHSQQLDHGGRAARDRLAACRKALALRVAQDAFVAMQETDRELAELALRFDSLSSDMEDIRSHSDLTAAALQARIALDAASQAESESAQIGDLKAELLARQTDVDGLTADARAYRVVHARERASYAERTAARARELTDTHPTCPPTVSAFDNTTGRVIAALEGWRTRPEPLLLDGPTAAEIKAELAALPESPSGDTEPQQSIELAARAHASMRLRLESHDEDQPPPVDDPGTAATEDELHLLADELALPLPALEEKELDSPEDSAAARGLVVIGAGTCLIILGVVLALLVTPIAGVLVVVLGIGLATVGILQRTRAADRRRGLDDAHARTWMAEAAHRAAVERRAGAERRAKELGLSADPLALRTLATRLRTARQDQRDLEVWTSRRLELEAALDACQKDLRGRLLAVAVDNTDDVGEMLAAYRKECQHRAQQLVQSERRPDLVRQLQLSDDAENRAADARNRREAAETGIAAVATMAGLLLGETPAETARSLEEWLEDQGKLRIELEASTREWSELQQLLDGSTLDELADAAELLRAQADELSIDLGPDELPVVEADEAIDRATALEDKADGLERQAAGLQAQIDERTRRAPNLSTARDAAEAAIAGLSELLAASPHLGADFDPENLPTQEDLEVQRDELANRLKETDQAAAATRGRLDEQKRRAPNLPSARDAAEVAMAGLSELLAASPHLGTEFDPENLPAQAALELRHAELSDQLAEIDRNADVTRGQLEERTRNAPDLPAAKESLEAAKTELARVQRLQDVLERTTSFLEEAQERVHRDIAPHLRDTVQAWLPLIFAGRYNRVLVDPESLDVKVGQPTGELRSAAMLSHGTGEQVYLLLRVALVEHLANKSETCPLLLDEVTAHADDDRAMRMMELLHELSTDRQIVVFSQESRIREWAKENLDGEADRLVSLSAP